MPDYRELTRDDLTQFVGEVAARVDAPGRLWLAGETSQLLEGWLPGVRRFWLTGSGGIDAALVQKCGDAAGADVFWESPADILPLPDGWEHRSRPTGLDAAASGDRVEVAHFDPYSVAFRLIARGDEEDYRAVLRYLEHEWMRMEEAEGLLAYLLPELTLETIEQDPAEFRRKWKGLRQMWRSQGRESGMENRES